MHRALRKGLALLCAFAIALQMGVVIRPATTFAAGPRLEDNPSVFGWEDDLDAAIAYMDGSYDIRAGRPARISFGIYNDPTTIRWYLEDDYLPMLTTEFERDNSTVKIQSFGNKVVVNGNDFVVAYSRVSVTNHGAAPVTLDPKASSELLKISDSSSTVAPGETANHDYMILLDKFGNSYAWPTDEELRAAAPDFDEAHTQMTDYWTNRLNNIAHFTELPDDRIRKSTYATFIQFCIINDNGLYAIGENGYDGGGSWKGDQLEMIVFNIEKGNWQALEQNMLDVSWYQWNEDSVWWKMGWLWAVYLQNTGRTQFVIDHFVNKIPDSGGKRYTDLEGYLDFIDESRDPVTGIMKESNIDTQGSWTMGEWNALIGLAGIRYISEYLGALEDDPVQKAQYEAWAQRAHATYDDLYEADLRVINATMEREHIDYIPTAINQSNEQNRTRTPSDGNWANHFHAGRWAYEAYKLGAYQGDLTVDGDLLSGVMTNVDRSFDYGLGRLVGTLPSYATGGFPGFFSSYNGSYGSGALAGDRYRSFAVYAYQMMLDNQQSPNGWWETVLYPGATVWEPGVHPIGGVGSNPHMWGNTSTAYALEQGFASQKVMNDPTKRDLIIGRGTPREWIAEGKVSNLVGFPMADGTKADIRLEGLSGNRFKLTLTGDAPTGQISLELAALLNDNVASVVADGVSMPEAYDAASGKVLVPGTTREVIVTLKDSFPYTSFDAADAGTYARESRNDNGNFQDVVPAVVDGENVQTGFKNRDSVITFQVYVAEAGTYEVTADVINKSGSDKTMSIYVNSEKAAITRFAPDGSKQGTTETLELRQGMNDISYKNDFADEDIAVSFAGIRLAASDDEADGLNLAYGRTVDSDGALTGKSFLTDGYIGGNTVATAAGQYLQIDLGDEYRVKQVRGFLDSAAGFKALLSEDSSFAGAQAIVSAGGAIKLDPEARARYVRVWAEDAANWSELQIYGRKAPPELEPTASNKAIRLLEAENADEMYGVDIADSTEAGSGGKVITNTSLGDWVKFEHVNFGNGDDIFQARVSSTSNSGGTIEIRIDSIDGNLAGSLSVPDTGSADVYRMIESSVKGVTGNHDLYLKFTGGGSEASMFNIDLFKLYAGGIRSVMVFAPHPDDDVLQTAGIIRQAVLDNVPVTIVSVTNGDDQSAAKGVQRIQELYDAQTYLGVKPEDILFLGYGDGTLTGIVNASDSGQVFTSSAGLSATYGAEDAGLHTYHERKTGAQGDYNKATFMGDIADILEAYMPTELYAPSQYDNHLDHRALYKALDFLLGNLTGDHYGYKPTLHRSVIQVPFDLVNWPERETSLNAPMRPFSMPAGFEANTTLKWADRESVPVPDEMMVLPRDVNMKYQTILKFTTAIEQDQQLWLSYVKSDEVFFPQYEFTSDEAGMTNVALNKPVTSSSSGTTNPDRATDGAMDDYVDMTYGKQWLQVDFGQSYDISKVNLWHYFEDARIYHSVVVQLSNDPTFTNGVRTVFNNDTANALGLGAGTDEEYVETPVGKKIRFDPINARYVRAWSNGSTANPANHIVEIQAFTADPSAEYAGTAIADNGHLTLTLSDPQDSVVAEDFTARMTVDGQPPVDLALADFAYDAGLRKATFSFPPLQQTDEDQHVTVSASFRSESFPDAGFKVPSKSVSEDTNLALGIVARLDPAGKPEDDWLLDAATDGTIDPVDNPRPGTDPLRYVNGPESGGFVWMTLDLGATYSIDKVKLWHYYPDGRKYRDVIVQVSDDPTFTTGVTTVYNNDADNSAGFGNGADSEYAESYAGKTITFEPAPGRYIRTSANGSDRNSSSHWVEFEVYGEVPGADELGSGMYYVGMGGVDGSGKIIADVQPGTTLASLVAGLNNDVSDLRISDLTGQAVSDMNRLAGTGMTVELVKDGIVADSATVVVYADLDGNGTVDGTDEIAITRYFSNWATPLTPYQLEAMDADTNGAIEGIDKIIVTRMFSGWPGDYHNRY